MSLKSITSKKSLVKRCPILDYLQTITVPTPFPVGPVNVYLALGAEPTLIDTGPLEDSTEQELRSQLGALGVAFKDIRRIVITHAHFDHFGLAAKIVRESGGRVFSHPRNRWWLTDFENERGRRGDFYLDVFRRSGAPSELGEAVGSRMRGMTVYAESIPADKFIPIEEGESISLDGDRWQVMHTPGHASGLICLYEPDSQTLLSNDHLLRDITSNPVLEPPTRSESERPRALLDYIASMQKTARLETRIALPGHGEPIYDVRALVEGRLAFHRARLDHIEEQLKCCAGSAYELCRIIFPRIKELDVFLGLSEVIGHLDLLEAERRVYRESRQGMDYYFAN